MAEGCGMLVGQSLRPFWTAERMSDGYVNHEILRSRLGWKDNTDVYLRCFVRIEIPEWEVFRIKFDEVNSLPAWADNVQDEIKYICVMLMERIKPIYLEFRSVKDNTNSQKKILAARAIQLGKYSTITNFVPPLPGEIEE